MKLETHLDTDEQYVRYSVPENKGATVQLLTVGGILVRGQWYGQLGEHFVGWAPMPKRDKAREAKILTSFKQGREMKHTKQFAEMLQMQFDMNSTVNKDWVHAGYPFLRAIIVEGAEGMEHYGWKWWKKQTTDLPNTQLEMVDIWHFALSNYWLRDSSLHTREAIARRMEHEVELHSASVVFDNQVYFFGEMDFIEKLELMIGLAVAGRFDINLFASAMADVDLNWDTLYVMYVAKNVLNVFRQKNGYKEGTYRKQWDGAEDNEFVLSYLKSHPETSPDRLYNVLKAEYARLEESGQLA